MANTTDIGRLYVLTLNLVRDAPLVHRAQSVEIDPPYRVGHPLILRIPFTGKAIGIGWWKRSGWTEEEAMLEAVSGWGMEPDEDLFEKLRGNEVQEDQWEVVV